MKRNDLCALLRANSYPGRGIVLGKTPDGMRSLLVYFIMGRSENSRNRVFVSAQGGIRTQAFDPEKLTDPSLVIYAPVRVLDGKTIVTNGDQTDTIFDALLNGGSFQSALRSREFEPDAPNYTPRISGLMQRDGSYALSILKSAGGDPAGCERFFFEYPNPIPGTGHFIHTYEGDGNPLPSFLGEPVPVAMENDLNPFAQSIWDSLHPENRVSLFVRACDIRSGEFETVIINQNEPN